MRAAEALDPLWMLPPARSLPGHSETTDRCDPMLDKVNFCSLINNCLSVFFGVDFQKKRIAGRLLRHRKRRMRKGERK